jgi:hypothetical protein
MQFDIQGWLSYETHYNHLSIALLTILFIIHLLIIVVSFWLIVIISWFFCLIWIVLMG